jgi:hypothetical protein
MEVAILMDIGAISMVINQSKVQQDAGIAVMKMAMNNSKETATQMAKMMKDVAIDPNLGYHLDVRV